MEKKVKEEKEYLIPARDRRPSCRQRPQDAVSRSWWTCDSSVVANESGNMPEPLATPDSGAHSQPQKSPPSCMVRHWICLSTMTRTSLTDVLAIVFRSVRSSASRKFSQVSNPPFAWMLNVS